MAAIDANGITLEFEDHGDANDPALIMIAGIGCQLIYWPERLIEELVGLGLRVVTFDNRDVGLSTKLETFGLPDIPTEIGKNMRGEAVEAPYLLNDMAADTVALMDGLGIDRAHLLGHSLGGMIGQLIAAHYPQRCRSFVSLSSHSGSKSVPPATPEALRALMAPPEPPGDRAAVIDKAVWARPAIGSPDYPTAEDEIRERAAAAYDRCYYPIGFGRQFLASLACGSRVDLLKTITVPSLVIHGVEDPLLHIEAGRDTARNIPDARIVEIAGMGHDLPDPLMPRIAELVAGHCRDHP